MAADIQDLMAFVAVVKAGGFREGARASGKSTSSLSDAVRRIESGLGVRLLNRTTRSVVPTEAGTRLMERIVPALGEVESALDVVNDFRDRPSGTLKLNVPASAARLVLPAIVTPFLQAHPDIRLEVIVEESFVDMLAAGCDAGIRYDERLEQDMIAVPIGPRFQRFATAAAPAYLNARGRPQHPRDLLDHDCLRGKFPSGSMPLWSTKRTAKSSASTRPARWSSISPAPSTSPCKPPSTAWAWFFCSKTGWARTWKAARWSRCWKTGGRHSAARFFITPAADTCRRR